MGCRGSKVRILSLRPIQKAGQCKLTGFFSFGGGITSRGELKRYQRRVARKVKFSQNRKKTKAKVTQIHIDIGNARKDYLHKASHAISQNHAIVCIEDLQIRNMSKSSKGNAETHGKQVKQKSGLRQLDDKLAWHGGDLIAVPPTTPAGRVRRVGISQKTTAAAKPSSPASHVATRTTPMWSARSMF